MPETTMSAVSEKPKTALSTSGDRTETNPANRAAASPWQMMRRMQEEVDRVFSRFITEPSELRQAMPALPTWAPNVDISETDTEFCIEAELPGVKQKDITLELFRHQLTLHASMKEDKEMAGDGRQYFRRERHSGHLMRTLTLPPNVDEEKIHCVFEDGVLTCHLPKTEDAPPNGRRIPIGGAQAAPERSGT